MIRLTRKETDVDKIRAYRIFIDGVYRGDIKNGEVKEFQVENGKRTICAKIDWCGSGDYVYEVNDLLELEVGPTLTKNDIHNIPRAMLYISFLRKRYLWFERKDNT
jgi:hypothetical protein